MKHPISALALTLLTTAAVAAPEAAPTPSEVFTQTTIPAGAIVGQWVEYDAVMFAGKSCKLFTDAEQQYWTKLWYAALETMLSERDQKLFAKEKFLTRNSDKLEARVNYFLKTGCGSLELVAKVQDMKKRMRLLGFGLGTLKEANGKAIMDLSKEPAE